MVEIKRRSVLMCEDALCGVFMSLRAVQIKRRSVVVCLVEPLGTLLTINTTCCCICWRAIWSGGNTMDLLVYVELLLEVSWGNLKVST